MKEDKRKCVCFVGRNTPNHGLEGLIKRDDLYFKYFAENFDHLIFLDASKVFTSPVLSKGEVDEAAYRLLPAKFKVITPNNLADFKDVLKSHAMIVISNFSEEWYDWYIHYYLKRYKIPLIYIHTTSEISNFQQNLSMFRFRFLGRVFEILKKIYFRLEERLLRITVDTLFISNPQRADFYKKSSRVNEIVLTNSRFYDTFLAHSYPVTEDYVVFLDSMVPYHLDQMIWGHGLIDRSSYYSNLNRVLDIFEQKLGKKMVVCLHPQYDEENSKRDFGRRQTVKHRTREFTAQAAVVITHESSSVNNAVFYHKKVVQLTGSRFNDFTKANCASIQKMLGFPTIDMYEAAEQQVSDLLSTLKIDEGKYKAFLSNYIVRSGQEGISSYRKIADHIQSKYM